MYSYCTTPLTFENLEPGNKVVVIVVAVIVSVVVIAVMIIIIVYMCRRCKRSVAYRVAPYPVTSAYVIPYAQPVTTVVQPVQPIVNVQPVPVQPVMNAQPYGVNYATNQNYNYQNVNNQNANNPDVQYSSAAPQPGSEYRINQVVNYEKPH